jgi:hypothetical protein
MKRTFATGNDGLVRDNHNPELLLVQALYGVGGIWKKLESVRVANEPTMEVEGPIAVKKYRLLLLL